jgi:sodium-dependent dicarboxylate transporter 2/3/5
MKRWGAVGIAAILVLFLPAVFIDSPLYARIISIGGICLLLWITEIVPPFVPTFLLWALIPIFLAPLDSKFALTEVLSWAADPVILLFFAGFILGVATERTGLDKRLLNIAVQRSGDSYAMFLLVVITISAFLSMWISNIAAAALVFACLQPALVELGQDDILRRVVLIGVAVGADLGGIATPIGTGPNAIAIASISPAQPISFLSWMIFAFPLAVGMLVIGFLLLRWRTLGSETHWPNLNHRLIIEEPSEGNAPQKILVAILICTATAWLAQPLHGIPAPIVAIVAVVVVFASRILTGSDLRKVDWSTLLLIAGGITLGRLLEQSGAVATLSSQLSVGELHPVLLLLVFCLASAGLSAVMSNTATAVLLIPLALAFMPAPSTAILIAISASFGIPLIISTPPNAMAFGQGGIRFGDMFWPGLVIMLLGCAIVASTGRYVLNLAGIP